MIEMKRNGEIVTLDTRGDANEMVDKQLRYSQIIGILEENEMLTAKEIAVEMHKRGYIPTAERNFSAPRLTEMSHNGVVEPVGKVKCKYTNRTVAVYKLTENYKNYI